MVSVIPDVALIDNTSQRLACALVLDGSDSMSGAPIQELNDGLRLFAQAIQSDNVARQRVQLLLIRVGGGVEVVTPWTDALSFIPPAINHGGGTPLGAGVIRALADIEQQKANYRSMGIPYNRPWLFVFTDGEPTDDWEPAAQQCRAAEAAGKVVVFCIGIGSAANLSTLGKFTVSREPARLDPSKFKEFFVWLSQSASVGSQTQPGQQTQMASPAGWAMAPG